MKPLRIAYALLLFSLLGATSGKAERVECFDDIVCIHSEQEGELVKVFVENRGAFELTLEMDIETVNMQTSRALPYVATYPGRKKTQAVTLRIEEGSSKWSFQFALRWVLGSLHARHDDGYLYALPYRSGTSYLVGQGYNGQFSHAGKYAIDWDMPQGTPVLAAREGVVAEVEDRFAVGGTDEQLKTKANFIKIRHADGTFGHYVHLQQGGARVRPGQRVRKGQRIGISGNTGFSSGPHLHFEVYRVTSSLGRYTFPIRFRIQGGSAVVLQEGQTY